MTKRRNFGSVRKLPSGRWQASYPHNGSRHTASTTFSTKAGASTFLSTVETDIHRGDWIDPKGGKVLFRDYAKSWLASRPDLRPRSVIVYRSLLECHLSPTFGDTPIAKVSPSLVRTWHAALVAEKAGSAPAAYRLLRAVFSSAVHDGLLLRSPCRVPKAGSDRSIERPMLTVAQVRSLTLAMPGHLQAAVTLAAWGGLRRGEVLALRRCDVDELRSVVRVERGQVELSDGTLVFGPPKTDAGVRNVHLPEPAVSDLTSHLASYVGPEPDALVFTGRGGVPMRPKTLATAFNSARLRCGLPGVRFHDLRHFALTMAAATGATTKELMRRAGHSSPAAALRYQHATEDRDKAIADALSGLSSDAQVIAITDAEHRPSRTRRARQVTP